MPSPLVEKLLDKNLSEQSLVEFEEDFHPSSEGLWSKAKEIAESKFGFPSSEGLDYAIKWFNLKEGYWITYLTDEELEEFFQMEDDDLTEGTLHHWFKGSKSKDGKPGWVQADGSPCANEKGETKTPKCFSSGRLAALKRKGKKGEGLIRSAVRRKRQEDPGQQSKSGASKPTNVKTFAKGKKDKDYVKAEPKLKKEEVELQEKKDKKGSGSGTKDACYHKVKARYSVWPSAYASGALVKCRKKGAANWGNSTKKEEVQHVNEKHDTPKNVKVIAKELDKAVEMHKSQAKRLRKAGISEDNLDEKCWPGYEKKGMKTMFGKRYPNCVKKTKKEEVEIATEGKSDGDPCWDTHKQVGMKKKNGRMVPNCVPKNESVESPEMVEEGVRMPAQNGNVYVVMFNWRGKLMVMKVFFPEVRRPSKSQIQDALNKIYPGSNVTRYDISDIQPGETHLNMGIGEESQITDEIEEGAAWTKKSGKNESGGLNEKGRKSYERENPGSDLKRPSKKVGNPRRKSFCARMKGMKKKLTSSKTANDPDSRINKSLRAWNC